MTTNGFRQWKYYVVSNAARRQISFTSGYPLKTSHSLSFISHERKLSIGVVMQEDKDRKEMTGSKEERNFALIKRHPYIFK
jgi:hypothetical protein